DDRSDEGHEDRAGQPAERRVPPHLAEDPATQERADDADDDVAEEPIAPSDDERGQDSGHQPNDDPGKDAHLIFSRDKGRLRRPGVQASTTAGGKESMVCARGYGFNTISPTPARLSFAFSAARSFPLIPSHAPSVAPFWRVARATRDCASSIRRASSNCRA